jgi:DNA-binding beta-propeller fold protein YncE
MLTSKRHFSAAAFAATAGLALATSAAAPAQAEILAMMNYETKSPDSLKTLKLSGDRAREEGIAVMDVDPASERFGDILMTIPLPPDLVAHHIFYDRSMTKAYVTALGKSELQVIDMTASPYRMKTVELPDCAMGEDVIFSEDNSTWYLTCMMSAKVVVGDRESDAVTGTIDLPDTYPHGIAINSAIDRILVTSTIKGDLTEPGETISVVEASSLTPLGSFKVSNKPSPSGEAPVEILFVPGSEPATAYISNMFGGSIWAATWNADKNDFEVTEAYNFADEGDGVVLELYFNDAGDRLYVTTAKPGRLHSFDISGDLTAPQLLKSLPAGEGAHHVAFTQDGKLAFVQNALLNLPGMSEGTITVVDMEKEEVIAQIDTLQQMGYNPNSIVLLPDWNHFAGH